MVTDLIFKFWIFSVKDDWSENYLDKISEESETTLNDLLCEK